MPNLIERYGRLLFYCIGIRRLRKWFVYSHLLLWEFSNLTSAAFVFARLAFLLIVAFALVVITFWRLRRATLASFELAADSALLALILDLLSAPIPISSRIEGSLHLRYIPTPGSWVACL